MTALDCSPHIVTPADYRALLADRGVRWDEFTINRGTLTAYLDALDAAEHLAEVVLHESPSLYHSELAKAVLNLTTPKGDTP